jgi:hypothetical protein
MLIFRSEEHVERWCSIRDLKPGAVLALDQAWELASDWYGDKLKADWRRHTVEETEALLTRLGLTGEFWSLR